MPAPLLVARSTFDLALLPAMANRHGLVTGATGTGKTVTLQALAERFSAIGVPVFLADVKGDLAGLAAAGGSNAKVAERVKALGLEPFDYRANPVVLWDVFGQSGHPLRATISEMGPLLLARVLALESQGGDKLFGEPALDLGDLLRTDLSGRGQITVLHADRLFRSPRLYAAVLLWILSELFEHLPEVGDPEKPRLALFLDEAHLLFADAPQELQDKIEQVVRLIRSKGVGVYLVTQNPLDVPDAVLGQLGNRVQHALRAFTPRDQKAVRSAAETFRANPKVDVEKAITELAVGEALVSLLDEKGAPRPVERALVVPPRSRLAPLTPEERAEVIRSSPLRGRYDAAVDRESAYELLQKRAQAREAEAPPPGAPAGRGRAEKTATDVAGDMIGKMAQSAMRAAGTQIGREIMRGILGSMFGGRRR